MNVHKSSSEFKASTSYKTLSVLALWAAPFRESHQAACFLSYRVLTAGPCASNQVAGGQHVPVWFVWLPAASRGPSFDPQRFDPAGPAFSEDVELILQGIGSRHNSEGQDNDQPDYDSVASDEDPVQEATCGDSGNDGRTKVRIDAVNHWGPIYTNVESLEMHKRQKKTPPLQQSTNNSEW